MPTVTVPATIVGNIAAGSHPLGTYGPNASLGILDGPAALNVMNAPSDGNVYVNGMVPGITVGAAPCDDAALETVVATYDLTAVGVGDVRDDFLVSLVHSGVTVVPIVSTTGGLFDPDVAAIGQESAASPPGPFVSAPRPQTFTTTWDLSGLGLTVADIGDLSFDVIVAVEGGTAGVVELNNISFDVNDDTCPAVAPTMVMPVNARLRQCDLDYLASQITFTPAPVVPDTWITRAVDGVGVATIAPVAGGAVRSFTVTVDRGQVDVVLPSGDTVRIRGRGSRTWDANNNTGVVDGLPSVTGVTANSEFDLIWEEM